MWREFTRGSHFRERRLEQKVVGAHVQREALVVIRNEELAVELQLDAPALEFGAVLQPQHRQQDFVLQLRLQRRPVNVEVLCEPGRPAIGQHVLPPRVVLAYADMVRHDVEHEADAARLERICPGTELFVCPDLWIQLIVVGDVVPVRGAGTRLEYWGRIQMAYPHGGKVVDQPQRVGKTEARVELQPISREWPVSRIPCRKAVQRLRVIHPGHRRSRRIGEPAHRIP